MYSKINYQTTLFSHQIFGYILYSDILHKLNALWMYKV